MSRQKNCLNVLVRHVETVGDMWARVSCIRTQVPNHQV